MSRLNVDKITGATGTASGAPITLSGDTATLGSAVDLGLTANHSGVKTALNASGTAPIYACRAWVKCNSSGTISASQNVTSVGNSSTGQYTVNFATSMPSADYAVVLGKERYGANDNGKYANFGTLTLTATSAQFQFVNPGVNFYDVGTMFMAVFA